MKTSLISMSFFPSTTTLSKTTSKGSSLYIKTTIFYDNHIQRYRNSLLFLFLGYTLHKVLPTGYVHIVLIKVPMFVSPLLFLTIYINGSGYICHVLFIGK